MSIAELTEYESFLELNEMIKSGDYPDFKCDINLLKKLYNISDDEYEDINNEAIPCKKGIVYMIWCNTTNTGYIGHTIQGLQCRAYKHRNDYVRFINNKLNYRTYFDIISNDNYEHSILEEFNYQDRSELFNKEAMWIDKKTKEGVTLVNTNLMKKRLPPPPPVVS